MDSEKFDGDNVLTEINEKLGHVSGPDRAVRVFDVAKDMFDGVLADQASSNDQLLLEFKNNVLNPIIEVYQGGENDEHDLVDELKLEFSYWFGEEGRADDKGVVGEGLQIVEQNVGKKLGAGSRDDLVTSAEKAKSLGSKELIVKFEPANKVIGILDELAVVVDSEALSEPRSNTDLGYAVSERFMTLGLELSERIETTRDEVEIDALTRAANVIKNFGEINIDAGWYRKWRSNWKGVREGIAVLRKDKDLQEF